MLLLFRFTDMFRPTTFTDMPENLPENVPDGHPENLPPEHPGLVSVFPRDI